MTILRGLLKVQGIQIAARQKGERELRPEATRGTFASAVASREPAMVAVIGKPQATLPPPIPETVVARKLRMARTLRESEQCQSCLERDPTKLHIASRWDGYRQVTVFFCDECIKKEWHELDGIWR